MLTLQNHPENFVSLSAPLSLSADSFSLLKVVFGKYSQVEVIVARCGPEFLRFINISSKKKMNITIKPPALAETEVLIKSTGIKMKQFIRKNLMVMKVATQFQYGSDTLRDKL